MYPCKSMWNIFCEKIVHVYPANYRFCSSFLHPVRWVSRRIIVLGNMVAHTASETLIWSLTSMLCSSRSEHPHSRDLEQNGCQRSILKTPTLHPFQHPKKHLRFFTLTETMDIIKILLCFLEIIAISRSVQEVSYILNHQSLDLKRFSNHTSSFKN